MTQGIVRVLISSAMAAMDYNSLEDNLPDVRQLGGVGKRRKWPTATRADTCPTPLMVGRGKETIPAAAAAAPECEDTSLTQLHVPPLAES